MKSILITGGAGFIGSNFVEYFLRKNEDFFVVNLDLLTYAGNLANLSEVFGDKNLAKRHKFIKGDICNDELLAYIFAKFDIKAVIHFAAESHVDNSIANPAIFTRTNALGTQSLLEAAKRAWLDAPHKVKEGFEECRFHHISTDEVYGSLGTSGLFSETSPYAPNSPYSASKAASDMLVRAYHETFGLNTIITNCSNNYGAKQHSEKLIPTIIRSCLKEQAIPIYGDGLNVRDWLYVKDHCVGIEMAFFKGKNGENYNIGGRNERTNLQIVTSICEILDGVKPRKNGKYADLISFVKDRAGHDRRYAIDASKIENELGYKAQESFQSGIAKTIEWYLQRF